MSPETKDFIDKRIAEEIEKLKRKDHTVNSNNIHNPDADDIARMKAEGEAYQKSLAIMSNINDELDKKYTGTIVYPQWTCPICKHEQVLRGHGARPFNAKVICSVECIKCQSVSYFVLLDDTFDISHCSVKWEDTDYDKIEAAMNELQEKINKSHSKSIVKKVRKLLGVMHEDELYNKSSIIQEVRST